MTIIGSIVIKSKSKPYSDVAISALVSDLIINKIPITIDYKNAKNKVITKKVYDFSSNKDGDVLEVPDKSITTYNFIINTAEDISSLFNRDSKVSIISNLTKLIKNDSDYKWVVESYIKHMNDQKILFDAKDALNDAFEDITFSIDINFFQSINDEKHVIHGNYELNSTRTNPNISVYIDEAELIKVPTTNEKLRNKYPFIHGTASPESLIDLFLYQIIPLYGDKYSIVKNNQSHRNRLIYAMSLYHKALKSKHYDLYKNVKIDPLNEQMMNNFNNIMTKRPDLIDPLLRESIETAFNADSTTIDSFFGLIWKDNICTTYIKN